MCCGEVIAKYVLFFANIIFSFAGLTIIGIGIALLIQMADLQEILPINMLLIGLIVLGVVIFVISFFACCGATRESRWMLITYIVIMVILAAAKIYLTVVIFTNLPLMNERLTRWLNNGFYTASLRPVFHVLEVLFSCCGTTGPSSYQGIMVNLPPSCCANPVNNICPAPEAFSGCTNMVIDYFDTFGEAIGSILIVIIIVEVVAIVLAWFFSYSISKKRARNQII